MLAAWAALGLPQAPEDQTRSLWDTTFLRNRPASKHVPAGANTLSPPATKGSPAPAPENTASGTIDDAFVGLTVWRLRRSRSEDEGRTRLFVHEEGQTAEWTPERVTADAPLTTDPRFRYRFSVETARAGYLYIVDREQLADSLGPPVLIFPTTKTRGGDNWITPGVLVEIPAQTDKPPYLKLDNKHKQVGEVLTFLIMPRPLQEITIGSDALELAPRRLAEWEQKWAAPVTRLESTTAGKAWTTAELEAAGGGKPLTRNDPTPQTLFKVQAKAGEPLLVTVWLRIRQ
jgi:hypothetical protein